MDSHQLRDLPVSVREVLGIVGMITTVAGVPAVSWVVSFWGPPWPNKAMVAWGTAAALVLISLIPMALVARKPKDSEFTLERRHGDFRWAMVGGLFGTVLFACGYTWLFAHHTIDLPHGVGRVVTATTFYRDDSGIDMRDMLRDRYGNDLGEMISAFGNNPEKVFDRPELNFYRWLLLAVWSAAWTAFAVFANGWLCARAVKRIREGYALTEED